MTADFRELTSDSFSRSLERLLSCVQSLSLARDLETIMALVRKEARELTGADGATFVLREGDNCYYAEENAIAPLWKGKRFPMSTCISGWVMLNKQAAMIEDIYADPRIPVDAYRPTFVKSLLMVPIRKDSPIGAIGNYWSKPHVPTMQEIKLLQALADSTSIAIENVQLYADLESHLKEITAQEERYKSLSVKLQESLNEKDVLLKEVYHRVKNNLQVVTSLLTLQAKQSGSESSSLMESISRIHAMALVHEMLYQSKNLAKIPMRDYVTNLFKYLYEIHGIDPGRIILKTQIDDVYLKIDTAIPCGLIINEIVSNAFKHAFPENKVGEIEFILRQNDSLFMLKASDNGIGLSNDINLENPTTLGLRLIQNLSRQVGGKVSINTDQNGTQYILIF